MRCNLCSSSDIRNLGKIGINQVSVTSDAKLINFSRDTYVCERCSHIQKVYDEEEYKLIDAIYAEYAPHHLSKGSEQLIFSKTSPPRPRSYHVLEKCVPFLPQTGKLLDVGTGNGAVLKSASKLLTNWKLYGFDIVDKYRKEVSAIPRVDNFFSDNFDNIHLADFDLIVLWHALEHTNDPLNFILKLKDKLSDNGHLLIQVPDAMRNPFDLVVIDHYSHFTRMGLKEIMQSLGFTVILDGYDLTHNCLSFLFKRGSVSQTYFSPASKNDSAQNCFDWLNGTVSYFENATKSVDYAIFGTGMASIWLLSQLSRRPLFFLDEDPDRQGSQINNIAIISPGYTEIKHLNIILPFMYPTDREIASKLKKDYSLSDSNNFILPPAFLGDVNENC